MSGKVAVLLVLATINFGHSLNLQKVVEGKIPSFCLFGTCFQDKKDYDKSVETNKKRDSVIEELNGKQEEMETWKKEQEEREQLEAEERKAKEQDEKDRTAANTCQCTWECGDRNDGTVCFRKCCNGEFGGPSPADRIQKEAQLQAVTQVYATLPPVEAEAPKAEEHQNPFAAGLAGLSANAAKSPFNAFNPFAGYGGFGSAPAPAAAAPTKQAAPTAAAR